MKKKKNLQQILSFLFLLLTLGIVLYIGLSGNDLADLIAALKSLTPKYLLICLLCWGVYVLTDALAVHHFLAMQGTPVKLWQSIHAAVIGLYYCNVTPGATGGQPMEMYCLKKYGVPIGISGSAMAVKFVIFQAILLITGAVMWLTNASFVGEYAGSFRWFVVLGYIVNFFSIGMVALMAISQKAVRWVIEKCIRIGARLHICKDPDASRARWEEHCSSFLGSVQMVMRSPKDLLIQCAIAFAQLMSLMAVILAIYHAMGLEGVGSVQLVTLGVLLYIAASYTPLPGASGAQEGGFVLMFQAVFPDAMRFIALLIWRFTTYYLTILVGAVVSVVENVHGMRSGKTSEAKEASADE